jgi:hypothetical protein
MWCNFLVSYAVKTTVNANKYMHLCFKLKNNTLN